MGIIMLLDRTEILGGVAWQAFPGLILVLLGVTGVIGNWRLCDGHRGSPLSGIWLILVGAWLIVSATHAFGLTYRDSWPLLVVAAGAMIVVREVFPGLRREHAKENR
jgi:hypothetical protein